MGGSLLQGFKNLFDLFQSFDVELRFEVIIFISD